MNPFFIQIRKYTLQQIMNMPILPKPKAPLKLLQKPKRTRILELFCGKAKHLP